MASGARSVDACGGGMSPRPAAACLAASGGQRHLGRLRGTDRGRLPQGPRLIHCLDLLDEALEARRARPPIQGFAVLCGARAGEAARGQGRPALRLFKEEVGEGQQAIVKAYRFGCDCAI